jgi:AcrR family transcriptional regulator
VRKGQQTRQRILLRAARLFNQKGYHGSSLSDVLRATGLQKGGIYNHFESKEQLAVEAFDTAIQLVARRFEQALAGKRHGLDRLHAIVDVFRGYAIDPPVPGGCPIMNTAIENDDGNPTLRRRARQAMDQYRAMVRTIVTKGIERGELRANLDPDQVVTLLTAACEGGLMLSKLYDDPGFINATADHLSRYVDQNLRP